jgi:outer membrane lipoprotein-sorting protein
VNIFRRLSTSRLLALCAAVMALGLAIVAVAGAVGSDPKPPPPAKLADAIHTALVAPPVQGVTADVEFSNNLVGASGFEGVSPLIAGAKGRVWWTDDERFRLELTGPSGDAQIVVDKRDVWAYDGSGTVYRGTLPAEKAGKTDDAKAHHGVPTVAEIEAKLQKALKDVAVAGPDPGVEAGQPAYSVRVTPRDPGGLLGGVGLAWDAVRGTPLRVGVYARGNDTPVLEIKATDISYGPVDAAAFAIQPPPGVKVVDVAGKDKADHGAGHETKQKPKLSDVAFDVKAPAELAGRPRTELHAVRFGDQLGAVAVYGEGLDSLVVIERPEQVKDASTAPNARNGWDHGGDHHGQVELPSIDVGGVQGQVLATPLGSGVQWTAGGVTYVVAGSQPRSVTEAAARGL